jgi:hypothetical protein
VEERLARPRFGAVGIGGKRVRRLGEDDRLSGFLHMCSTSLVLQNLERCALASPLSSGAV